MVQVAAQTVKELVEEGLAIVSRERIRPSEAARRIAAPPYQLSPGEVRLCIERAIGDWIEEALSVQRSVPRFNLQQERRDSLGAVQELDLQPLEQAAIQAARKLDALYCTRNGEMKRLSQFTVEDHEWRAAYAAAQAQTWVQWGEFHRQAAVSLVQAKVDAIENLPEIAKSELEGLIP